MNLQINKFNYINKTTRLKNKRKRILLLSALWVVFIGISTMSILLPSTKKEVQFESTGLVVNGTVINTQDTPEIRNSVPYLSFDNIKKYINKDVLYDVEDEKIVLTTKDKVARIGLETTKGLINNKPLILSNSIIKDKDKLLIPLGEFEELLGISVEYNIDSNVVFINTSEVIFSTGISKYKSIKMFEQIQKDDDYYKDTIAKLSKGQPFEIIGEQGELYKIRTYDGNEGLIEKELIDVDGLLQKTGKSNSKNAIRKMPSIKQPIYKELEKGELVNIYGEVDGWYKVRGSDGTVGFIKKADIDNEKEVIPAVSNSDSKTVWKPLDGKINIVWEQVEYSTPKMNNVDKIDGLDVVCPTWFEVIKADGTLKNKADYDYVRWARGNGYKVWALVSNGVSTDTSEMTSKFLNSSNARENTINKLIEYSNLYDLDGINIDFEHFPVDDKEMLTQFLRELAPMCYDKGLVLSVDVTVKVDSPNSLCFDRKQIGKIVDYVIVMTYDQYWSTSPVSGSVAEYSWVDENIKILLNEVLNNKLIMGIPFYTRQWKETANSKPISASIGMANAKNIVRQNNAKIIWNDKSGQYYAEFDKDIYKYKIWLEDEKSINLKSSLALKHDLAGVASWRRGFETHDIWSVLNRNLKEYSNYSDWEQNNS